MKIRIKIKNKTWPFILVVCMMLGMSSLTFGQRYVAETGTDAGSCPVGSPCRTLIYALSVASNGEEIIITPGDYTVNSVVYPGIDTAKIEQAQIISFQATAGGSDFLFDAPINTATSSITIRGLNFGSVKAKLVASNPLMVGIRYYNAMTSLQGFPTSNISNLVFQGFGGGAIIQDYPNPSSYPHDYGAVLGGGSITGLSVSSCDFVDCGYSGNKRVISLNNNAGQHTMSNCTFVNTSATSIKFAIYLKGGMSGGSGLEAPSNFKSRLRVSSCSFGTSTVPLYFENSADTLACVYVEKLTRCILSASFQQSSITTSTFNATNIANFETTVYSDILIKDMRGFDVIVNGNTHYQLGFPGNTSQEANLQYVMMNIPEGSGVFADIDMQGTPIIIQGGSASSYTTEICLGCLPGPYANVLPILVNNLTLHYSNASIIALGIPLPIRFPDFVLQESSDAEWVEIILARQIFGIWAEWSQDAMNWKRVEGWRISKRDIQTSTIYVRLAGIENGRIEYSNVKSLQWDELGLRIWLDGSDLILSVKQQVQAQIQVSSLDGKIVLPHTSVSLVAGDNRFPFPGSAGMYIVKIWTDGRLRSFKFLKF